MVAEVKVAAQCSQSPAMKGRAVEPASVLVYSTYTYYFSPCISVISHLLVLSLQLYLTMQLKLSLQCGLLLIKKIAQTRIKNIK